MRRSLLSLFLLSFCLSCGGQEVLVTSEGTTDAMSTDNALTYALSVSPASATVAPGASVVFTVKVTASGSSSRKWNLSAASLPAAVSASINPATITAGQSASMTLSVGAQANAGTSALTVHATSGFYTHSAAFHLTVEGGGTGGGAGGGGGGGSGGGAVGGGAGGGTAVGPTGGSVPLLHFGLSGDTRPPACEDTAGYPTAIIDSIADHFQARGAQFVVDLGDHMYVCNGDLNTADAQMTLYMNATHRYAGTWFMTMGNHECWHGPCLLGSQNANYLAFMSALSPVASKPYYSFDVQTSLGKATFVVIADNGWDAAQASWLDQTLTDADATARYTIVIRHHPEGDTSVATNPQSMQIIRAHKFALFLTGHSHLYKHMTTDNGRDLVLGIGGAPLIAGGAFNGYAMIDQLASGELRVSVYNLAGDLQVDQWSVGPN